MKLTREQREKVGLILSAKIREVGFVPHGPVMLGDFAAEAFAAIEPTQVEVLGDLVEAMISAFNDHCSARYTEGNPVDAMTAALRVVLNDPRVLGEPKPNEVDASWFKQGMLSHREVSNVVAHFIASRRSRLLEPRAKTPSRALLIKLIESKVYDALSWGTGSPEQNSSLDEVSGLIAQLKEQSQGDDNGRR